MDVILYSTNCPHCVVLKKGLDKNKINYRLISDEDEIIKLGISSIPTLEVDGKRMDYPEAFNFVKNFAKHGG